MSACVRSRRRVACRTVVQKEVVKLVSSAVAEGGGPGVVVFLVKACGCDDQLVLEAEI